MAYAADFYIPDNIIGYTGVLSKNPTVYFLSATRVKFFRSIFCTVSTLAPADTNSSEILSMASLMPSSLPDVFKMNKPSYRFTSFVFRSRDRPRPR